MIEGNGLFVKTVDVRMRFFHRLDIHATHDYLRVNFNYIKFI